MITQMQETVRSESIVDVDDDGSTILHSACLNTDVEVVDLVCRALEEINSDINLQTQDSSEVIPFHRACEEKGSDVAISLLKRYPRF